MGDLDLERSLAGDLDRDLLRAGEAERSRDGDLPASSAPFAASAGCSSMGLGDPSSDMMCCQTTQRRDRRTDCGAIAS